MEEKPKRDLEFREMPGPLSGARYVATAFMGACAMLGMWIADVTGVIVGLVAGAAISVGILLWWSLRPK